MIHHLSDFPYEYVTPDNSETGHPHAYDADDAIQRERFLSDRMHNLRKQVSSGNIDMLTKTPIQPKAHVHPKFARSWQNDPNHNVEPIPTFSDKERKELESLEGERSFTELDEPVRTVSNHGMSSIAAFLSKWGYVGNSDMLEDLTVLLETVSSDNSDVKDFLNRWGISDDRDYSGMSGDLHNMLAWENNPMARESGSRVERYFLTKQGEVWLVTHITDIPEKSDNPAYAHITEKSPITGNSWGFVANDGMLTMVTAALYFTRERAMDSIREDLEFLTKFAYDTEETLLSHVYELDTLTA